MGKNFKKQQKYSHGLEKRAKTKTRENSLVNLYDMPKRPKSVFALYAADHKKEVEPGKGEGKGMHALKTKWAQADQAKKEEYESKEKELKVEWMKALEEFKLS